MNKERKNKFHLRLKQRCLEILTMLGQYRASGCKFKVSKHSHPQKGDRESSTLSTDQPHILTYYLTFVSLHSDNMETAVILQTCQSSKAVYALFLCGNGLACPHCCFPGNLLLLSQESPGVTSSGILSLTHSITHRSVLEN